MDKSTTLRLVVPKTLRRLSTTPPWLLVVVPVVLWVAEVLS